MADIPLDVMTSFTDDSLLAQTLVDPPQWLLVWDGQPPAPLLHPAIALIEHVGHMDDEPVYTERVPPGLPLEHLEVPGVLLPLVISRVIRGLEALHGEGLVHGQVRANTVWLGTQGQVLLTGRGRNAEATAPLDTIAAISMFDLHDDAETTLSTSTASATFLALEQKVTDTDERDLGRLVQELLDDRTIPSPLRKVLTVKESATDEVVPDIGNPEAKGGLLDFGVTTTGGWESTAEVTGVDSPIQRMAQEFWGQVAAPVRHPRDPGRFAKVDGVPSEGLRRLLERAAADYLPAPAGGDPGAFLMPDEELPTQVRPPTFTPAPRVQRGSETSGSGFRWDLVGAMMVGMALMWMLMRVL